MSVRTKFEVLGRLLEYGIDAPEGYQVGVLEFSVWMIPIMQPILRAVDAFRTEQVDAIVIDLRGNPGGVGGLAMGVGGHFFDEPTNLGTMTNEFGEMNFNTNPQRLSPDGKLVDPLSTPLAILIDDMSASTSEIFAGGMQTADRAEVVGRRTPGMALPAVAEELPNGDILYHAIAEFTLPDGATIEGIGISPDVDVDLKPEAFEGSRDPDPRAAVELLLRNGPSSTPRRPHDAGTNRKDIRHAHPHLPPTTLLGCIIAACPMLATPAAAQQDADATRPSQETLPTPREIIDRFIEVTGGVDAYKKHKFRTSRGAFEMPAMGMRGEMMVKQSTPNLMLVTISLPGIGEMKQGFNGEVGWSIDPMSGPQLMDGKQLEQMKREADFFNSVDILKNFKESRTVAKTKFNDEMCYQIKLTGDDGVTNAYYSVESGLAKGSRTGRHPAGRDPHHHDPARVQGLR